MRKNTLINTDLLLERSEELLSSRAAERIGEHFEYQSCTSDGIEIFRARIKSREGEKALGKPKGRYVTLTFEPFGKYSPPKTEFSSALCREIGGLCRANGFDARSTLVIGIGNRAVSADSFGPLVADGVLSTRAIKQISDKAFRSLGRKCVSAFSPGVRAATGISAQEAAYAAVKATGCTLVIALDALTSSDPARLLATVQLTDAGLVPGSASGANTGKLTEKTLGVPVIALGVPTTVTPVTLARLTGGRLKDAAALSEKLTVAPRDLDESLPVLSSAIAGALNDLFSDAGGYLS